jgi:hypothetical protein
MERRWTAVWSRGLRAFDVEINHNGVLSTSYHDGLAGFVGEGVDLLVRYVGWDVDEVASSGFTDEFEVVSPSHASPGRERCTGQFPGRRGGGAPSSRWVGLRRSQPTICWLPFSRG